MSTEQQMPSRKEENAAAAIAFYLFIGLMAAGLVLGILYLALGW